MATQYSQQQAQLNSQERTFLKPVEQDGRVRIAAWNFNTTDDATALAENDVIVLCKIPKGSRILRIRAWWEAMGANQTADIGIMGADGSGTYNTAGTSDDTDFFTTASLNVAAAGEGDAGVLQEDNPGYITEKDVFITATPIDTSAATAWAADKDFDGFVEYVVGN